MPEHLDALIDRFAEIERRLDRLAEIERRLVRLQLLQTSTRPREIHS